MTKEVQFAHDLAPETYHCLAQQDYIGILARTRTGLVPIVRQFRPAVERYTWELPAGLVEHGEDPAETCRRELEEETGLKASRIELLGISWADTGRLQNRMYSFFACASDPSPTFIPEDGMDVKFVVPEELFALIQTGEFNHQLHLGVIALASCRGIPLSQRLASRERIPDP